MIRVRFQGGVHNFDVDENLADNRFRLVSCNVAVPKKASCHPDLDKVLRSRMETKNGEGKGRAILLVEQKVRIILAVMTVHVDGKRLLIEIHVSPDAKDGLIYAAALHFRMCARRLAAHPEMNDGDDTFYLAVGRKQNRLRQVLPSLGIVETESGISQRIRFQGLYVCRPDQRVAVVRSR